uniref:Bifunctional cis-abienol synthase, chloroplastic n=1 Tax=Abies balsamea TaxID=90345 RepID=CAS_ABIBA|nr:RecName: Full=Bifunctional cis-abienol synthase, chloroplastic; AltName: Full=Diterpene synthase TPS4; Short=AbdiTPS4; Flags: Precursor [Abies balsamea]AEL99953.1 diterpene synthase TPS4 [Abies balsamea]
MALPVYSLKSHIPITTIASAKMNYTPNKGMITANGRSRRIRLSPNKIVACAGEADRTFPSQSLEKTALFPDQFSEKNGTPSNFTPPNREFPPSFWNNDIINSITASHKVQTGDRKRIQTLISEIKNVFNSMGDGETSPSAYDTAWVARIPAVDGSEQPQFPQTLEWILQNQLKDGSWGEEFYFLAYDRLLATLACIITLTIWRTGNVQLHKGIEFFRKQVVRMDDEADNHRPSGFEIVFPAMLNEAKSLGLDLPYELPFIEQMVKKREAKLKMITTNVLYTIQTTLLYSLEGLHEIVDFDKIIKLQSKDGSFLGSPASTAAVFMQTGNTKCLEFLEFVLRKFRNHVPSDYPLDLFERLWVVDTVERLGIDRHFKKEIKDALDYVYSCWDERGIGWAKDSPIADIDDTAMGLRILRLHGYNVSPDVLKTFKDENGEFFCFMGQTQRGVTDMLNVYRCSQVAFPGETIMEEAKLCTERYLRNALENADAFDKWAIKKNIRGEVEYALKYPWHRSMPRLEVRSYIGNYGPNDVWLGKSLYMMPYISNEKYLELAKLDFNSVQSLHQEEIRELVRWCKSSGFTELKFTRDRVVETYFAVASSMFEPEFSTCRAVYTKISVLLVILDDLYDGYGSPDEIKLFSEAVKRWDLSLLEQMPDHMKICFLGLYNTVNEVAEEGRKTQGHDVLGYIRNLWEIQLAAFTREAEWSQGKYVPSFDEYIENAQVSIGVATILLITILFTEEDDILSHIDYGSKFLRLASLTARLANDIKTYQEERAHGEVVSAIQCYMKDRPEITEEEALKYVYGRMVNDLAELNSEYLKSNEMPQNCKRLVFDTARVAQLFTMEGDGLTYSDTMEIKEHIKKCLFEPAT